MKKVTCGESGCGPNLYYSTQFLWRTVPGAPQKSHFLWRTIAGAPQNVVFLWRTSQGAPQKLTSLVSVQ